MHAKIKLITLLVFMTGLMFSKKLKEGTYRGVLVLDEANKIELPFNFEVRYEKKQPLIIIRNADEKIIVDEIRIKKDSLFFKMPVFDTEFKCVIRSNDWEGEWINHYRTEKNRIKFKATYDNANRFEFEQENPNPILEGKWKAVFSPGTDKSTPAVGQFHHVEQSNYLQGTFLTETGDYRFLEGIFSKGSLYLSCFDGSHAFLFVAQMVNGQTLQGKFYSGAHWQEDWTANKDDKAELKDPDQITYALNKNNVVDFSFPNLENKQVTLHDVKFLNKPVIIQVMGSWCPNCMDESKYLSEVYAAYAGKGLEIVALAFEKTTDFEKAKAQVLRLKNKLNINYEILITQQSGKEKASQSLAFLNGISAFPTTIFLDQTHKIVKVHTGFSGPATGKAYENFKQNTQQTISYLIEE